MSGLLGQIGDSFLSVPNNMAGLVLGGYVEQGQSIAADVGSNVASGLLGTDVNIRGGSNFQFKGLNGQRVRVGTSYDGNRPAQGYLANQYYDRFGDGSNYRGQQPGMVMHGGWEKYDNAFERAMTARNGDEFNAAMAELSHIRGDRRRISMPEHGLEIAGQRVFVPAMRNVTADQYLEFLANSTGNTGASIGYQLGYNTAPQGNRYFRQPEAGERGYEEPGAPATGAASDRAADTSPLPKGNGQVVDATTADRASLLLADRVTRDGQDLTPGERAGEYFVRTTEAFSLLKEPATAADVNAALALNPALQQRLGEMVKRATPAEQSAIADNIGASLEQLQGKLSEAEYAKIGPQLETMQQKLEQAAANPQAAAQQAQQEKQSQAARQAVLDDLKFVGKDGKEDKQLQEQYNQVLAAEREMNSGSPFLVFFKKIIAMIMGKDESAEKFAEQHKDALAPESRAKYEALHKDETVATAKPAAQTTSAEEVQSSPAPTTQEPPKVTPASSQAGRPPEQKAALASTPVGPDQSKIFDFKYFANDMRNSPDPEQRAFMANVDAQKTAPVAGMNNLPPEAQAALLAERQKMAQAGVGGLAEADAGEKSAKAGAGTVTQRTTAQGLA